MKRALLASLAAGLLFSLLANTQPVAAMQATPDEPHNGDVLCAPDAYLAEPGDCLPLGPSTVITDMALKGFTYPPKPLPASRADPSLNNLDVKYAKINLEDYEPAPIFGSLDDAIAGRPGRFLTGGDGLRYVSYQQRTDVEGNSYVMLPGGEWMRASPSEPSSGFQGLVFSATPHQAFGWIIEATTAQSAPSINATPSARQVGKEEVVYIFDVRETEGDTWYMIGMNEWVSRHFIRQFTVNTTPPQGVENNRWIEVNLYEQTIGVYENGELVFATLVATGVDPYFTRPGLFQITEKKATETMQGAFAAGKTDFYYLADVPWTMYFDQARALHGAYWRAWFGIPQSHGCVNLSIGDSHWLFNWANVGDWVYVWDPSGLTPTDPSLYTEGGA